MLTKLQKFLLTEAAYLAKLCEAAELEIDVGEIFSDLMPVDCESRGITIEQLEREEAEYYACINAGELKAAKQLVKLQ